MRKTVALCLSLSLTGLGTLEVASAASPPPATAENPLALELRVTGTIFVQGGEYYVRIRGPVHVLRIINPLPAVLDEFARTGKPVRIEALVVQGDNVAVETLDGRGYGRAEKGER